MSTTRTLRKCMQSTGCIGAQHPTRIALFTVELQMVGENLLSCSQKVYWKIRQELLL